MFSVLACAPLPLLAQYPSSFAPVVWWNDATDVTLGLWARTNPGSLGQWTVMVSRGFGGFQAATIEESVDFRIEVENPRGLIGSSVRSRFAGWAMDGTVGASMLLSLPANSQRFSAESGVRLQWVGTRETAYLDPNLWENAGSGEGTVFHRRSWQSPNATAGLHVRAGGGVIYRNRPPGGIGSRYPTQAFGRGSAELFLRRRVSFVTLGARAYAGAFLSEDPPTSQRAIPVHGADPYETLGNPWYRTEGAPLVDRRVFYHAPGNANLRGYRPTVAGRWVGAVNLELEIDLIRRSTGVFRRASLLGFWDGAVVDTMAARSFSGSSYRVIADAGPGLRIWLAFGPLRFPVRVELPLYVSEPTLAHDRERTRDYVEFRWLVSVQPIF